MTLALELETGDCAASRSDTTRTLECVCLRRVFECEVMPTLIYLLRSAQELEGAEVAPEADVQLEFGCLVVFACPQSCGRPADGYAYEYAHLQQAL